jgi:hypothetical protein
MEYARSPVQISGHAIAPHAYDCLAAPDDEAQHSAETSGKKHDAILKTAAKRAMRIAMPSVTINGITARGIQSTYKGPKSCATTTNAPSTNTQDPAPIGTSTRQVEKVT